MAEKSLASRGEDAFNHHKRLIDLFKTRNSISLEVIKELKYIVDKKLYKLLISEEGGSDAVQFNRYIRDEVPYFKSPSYARQSIQMYETFIIRLGIPESVFIDADKRKLISLLGTANRLIDENEDKAKEQINDIVQRMPFMQRPELDAYLRSMKAGMDLSEIDDHEHDWKDLNIKKCRICGMSTPQ